MKQQKAELKANAAELKSKEQSVKKQIATNIKKLPPGKTKAKVNLNLHLQVSKS